MSDARSTRPKSDAPQAEEAAVKSTKASELVKQGFVLEVTVREPDVRDSKGNIISKGKVFDRYHHACQRTECTHDPSTVGQWARVPAEDESRCVN